MSIATIVLKSICDGVNLKLRQRENVHSNHSVKICDALNKKPRQVKCIHSNYSVKINIWWSKHKI